MKITDFWFKKRNKELHLAVKPYKNGCRCPACGRRGRIVCLTTEFRRWEDLTLIGMKVLLWYAPKEIFCPTHGRMQETIPWAPAYSRITYRLEWRLCSLCQIMTQKAAAEILKMPPSTLSNLLHRIITRVRDGHKIRGLVTLGVDEISYLKGHKYATLVYDLDRSRVLWVGRGKGRETIDRFFNECLSKGQKARVLWASCDMSRAYTEAI
jgi:transposase